ncbi:MAG TPA: anhydro-N-acetylmuramic acid kinase [Gemmatimonadaceae bacterium]|nr:anhydro-N-acetylmuramic acid kinase [Gemmatimonadaceae bacterium]
MLTADVYVGLMSGTSLDGISAAAVRFGDASDVAEEDARPGGVPDTPRPTSSAVHPILLAYTVTPYSPAQRERLQQALISGSARDYCRLGFDLGGWLAEAAVGVMAEAGVQRRDVRAIGSHGQTLWHEPLHSTWQLGEAAVIAERTGVDVVSDFRVRDVAAAGQGAPLVPIADALLFAGSSWRALQNIGGIGNVTVVPPAASDGCMEGVRAFDTGPGVAVLDGVVRALAPGLPYDIDGRLAAAGTPVAPVLAELLAAPYFASAPPKSTGRELFDAGYVARLIARTREAHPGATTADVVATATALTAHSIADAYRRFLPEPITEVLLSGGGARNPTLVRMLAPLLAPVRVRQFEEEYFDGEAKEAVAFALLAYLHVHGEPGNVPRATGARGPRILGKLTPA